MVHRDPGPFPNVPVFWFKIRKDSKKGPFMAPRTDFSVVGETYDVALGACPITDLSSKYSPTAKEIKKFVFHKRWHKVELYSHQHADDSYDDDDTVHLHHRGLTMKHPLVFVDMNDDDYAQRHVERLEELEELDDESGSNKRHKTTFTKKLRCIGTCDWTAWVKDGAIPNMVKDEILYTDGLMDHWIANEPAYMAERRDGNGKVINRGYASRLYVQLLD